MPDTHAGKGATIGSVIATPGTYKNIDLVMNAQESLVRKVHMLKQFMCIKG